MHSYRFNGGDAMTTKELIAILRSLNCDECPNKEACHNMITTGPCMLFEQSATALEALTAELEAERHRHDRYVDFEVAEAEELARVKAENAALFSDIKYVSDKHNGDACFICKHHDPENDVCVCTEHCDGDKWEWRGVMPNGD